MIQLYTLVWCYSRGFDTLGFLKDNNKTLYALTVFSVNLEFIGMGLLIKKFLEMI